jgi:integrase
MSNSKYRAKTKSIIASAIYCYRNSYFDIIDSVEHFFEKEIDKIKTRKSNINAGIQRNDLPGKFKVIGNKIYVRYKGKDFSTGCSNSAMGWKMANKWWEEKVKEINAILSGEKSPDDTIYNAFRKFIDYKIQFNKISKKSIYLYHYRIETVFGDDKNLLLTENNIRLALDNFIRTTKLSPITINIVLSGCQTFFSWAAEEENGYIKNKNYIKKYKQNPQKSIKAAYTADEYNMIIDYFNKNHREMSLLIQFIWNTGSRISETINIKITDIDFKNNYIKIPNKIFKGEQETLLFTDEVKQLILMIIDFNKDKKIDKLFSWPGIDTPIKLLERLEKKFNMKIKRRGFHGFRRAFSDRLFEKEIDIPSVQEIMRHRSISTTLKHYKSFNKVNIIKKMNEKLK